MQDDRMADHGIRSRCNRNGLGHQVEMNFAIRVGGDVTEIARVMRCGLRRSMGSRSRIEVSARCHAVVAAVALIVNMKSMHAGRDTCEVTHDHDFAVAHVFERDSTFCGRAARRSECG